MTWKRRVSLLRNVSRTAIERYGSRSATYTLREVCSPRIQYTGMTIITTPPQIFREMTGVRIRQRVIHWYPRQDCPCRATSPFFSIPRAPMEPARTGPREPDFVYSPPWMACSLLSWNCDRGSVLGVSCSHQLIRWQSFST